jgi:hypothetical protein
MRLPPNLVGGTIGFVLALPVVLCVTPGEFLGRMAWAFMAGSIGGAVGAIVVWLATARGTSHRKPDAP